MNAPDRRHDDRGWNFAEHLARFGPDADYPAPTPSVAFDYCRKLAQAHYENFPVLSFAVPSAMRPHFANIYAYCRWSDDLGDEVGDAATAIRLLTWWRGELEALYRGSARHPVMVALAETVREFAIPPEPFRDLVTAFERDQTQTRYGTFEELLDYCRCSANPVGRLVLYLARKTTPDAFEESDAICTGLQLANFWQDVAVDWGKGRVYLPQEDLRRYGVSESDLAASEATPDFRRLLADEVDRTERMLRSGLPLARKMPGRLKLAVAMFAQGGLAVLRAIRKQDYDVLARRPKLSKLGFLGVAVRAATGLAFG